jgi:WD40 repeat protein
MAFSPNGKVLAIGTSIGQVKLFDLASGELIRAFDHEQEKLGDGETPKTLKSLPRAIGSVASLAFSPDGALLAVCGQTFAEFGDRFDRIERGGLRRAVTGPGRLKVWDVATGDLTYDLAGHSHAHAVAFASDGATLASAGSWEDGNDHGTGVIFWSVATGAAVTQTATPANGGARWLAISPDGKLAAVGTQVFDKDAPQGGSMGDICLIHTASGITEWQTRVPGWGMPIFSSDGKTVAVLSGGESIRFLNAETGQLQHEIRNAETGRWIAFTLAPQGNRLAIAREVRGENGTIEIWGAAGPAADRASPRSGELELPATDKRPRQSPNGASRFSPTSEVVLSMNSLKFMLDFDTGATMDPPATQRPEQRFMDVHASQFQPYQLPAGLTGASLRGLRVKPSDWNAPGSQVRLALAEGARPLTQMEFDPVEPATFFFRTRDGAEGVLQLVSLVEEPKGIRIRYKTVAGQSSAPPGIERD